MKRALLLAVLINVMAPAAAAPKAQSPQECTAYADLALVARAAAKHRVPRVTFDAMVPDVYGLNTDDAKTLVRLITDTAYGESGVEPEVFAKELRGGCMRSGGDMDAFLGTGV